jgi:hypothetical protein
MTMSIKRSIAAAALLGAGTAFAAGFQADLAWGVTLSHGTTQGDHDAPMLQFDAGWRFDGNLALEVVSFQQIDLYRGLFADPATAPYGFDRFLGVRTLGYLPLDKRFELVGGLGAGRSTLNNGELGAPDRKNTDALLTAGVQWRAAPHFNLGLDANYLTKTEVSTLMLHAQYAF